jgi:hypothetical protein
MNERDELPVVVAKVAVALVPLLLYIAAERPHETRRFLEEVTYRPRLALWRWRNWRRWSTDQRERYVELHGEPGT